MFETFLGLPAHPLIVHAAAVFVPLMIAAAVAYALVPRVRRPIGWLVLTLAVVGPAAAWAARLSGDAFRARLVRKGTASAAFLAKIDGHRGFAYQTSWYVLGLGGAMLLLVLVQRSRSMAASGAPDAATGSTGLAGLAVPPVVWLGLVVVVLVLSVVSGYYIFRTGDSGAHIVWQGV